MIRMGVGDEGNIDAADVLPQHLNPEIHRCIDQHGHAFKGRDD